MRRSLLILLLLPAVAQAWNDPGHMLSGIIAYRQMPEVSRRLIADRLRLHLRFEEDFLSLMPGSIPAQEQDMWVFAHAATWPDIARRFDHVDDRSAQDGLVAAYHQPRWHYVNLPTFLGEFEALQLRPVPANLTLAWTPGQALSGLNAVQALKRAVHAQHGTMTPARKAVLMAWIFHLVGDLHQPLHSTALFTTGAFPGGDRGGNRLVVDSSNLHAMWDGAVASGEPWNLLKALADELSVAHRAAGGRSAANLNFEDWLHESHALAETTVYSFEVRSAVQRFNDHERDEVPVAIGQAYVERMTGASRLRITEAGYRLGAWLDFFASQQD